MSKEVKPFGIPVVFEYSANVYCKYCNTWGSQEKLSEPCGNCSQVGYLMPNPFPDNMIPYVQLPEHQDKVNDLKLKDLDADIQGNSKSQSKATLRKGSSKT